MNLFSALILLLEVHTAFLATQSADIHVEFMGNGSPTIKITANRGCENITNDNFSLRIYPCSSNGQFTISMRSTGICKKEGSNICLNKDLEKEQCISLTVYLNKKWSSPLPINLENVTFFDETAIIFHPWKHQGNTSTLTLNRITSASTYKLKLIPYSSSKVSTAHFNNCSSVILNSEVDHPNIVRFTVDWSKNLSKACTYYKKLILRNYCKNLIFVPVNIRDLLYWKATAGKKVVENTFATNTWMILVMTAVILVVLVIMLIAYFLLLNRMEQRTPNGSAIQIDKGSLTSSPPSVLLVYSPCLHQEMAVLSTKLQIQTGLKIEDLYSIGDQDKINDPTVWLTRRLMDINVRFVLAVSTSTPSTQNNCAEKNEQGGAFHSLLDFFLHHLQSSKLAHDYTRIHHVRLENQIEPNLSNVTPGRLYLLPAHFSRLASNLTLPASMFSGEVFPVM